ncbi:MAG: enoyl-CoA hydratase/isomerase family protein [Gammaproteobacteria bacterium]|nr:enoyl-CoA hydratase/isomerase family protein [Gammaproteobacteria bacterium]
MEAAVQLLSLECDGVVGRIVLKRPPLNILTIGMLEQLNRLLRQAHDEPLRALVLAAEGKAFSAGVAVEDHLPDKAARMLAVFHETFRLLRSFTCPVVSAVQGPALGGGCELACFADLVIAGEGASFGQPEIKLAVFPPIAALHFPHRIGLPRTLQLLLTGEVIPAREAERIGLVDRVVPAVELSGAVDATLRAFRELSGPALHLTKRAVRAGFGRDFEAGLAAMEELFFNELMKTDDAIEGLQAFIEKRTPVWKHR